MKEGGKEGFKRGFRSTNWWLEIEHLNQTPAKELEGGRRRRSNIAG